MLDIRRRQFITLLGSAAVAWPLGARAQQTERMRRIGVLSTGSGSTSQLIMRTYPDARLRADARGRDGGVREELAAGAKGVDRPAGGSIQNNSGLSQGLAGRFRGGSQTEAY
jgi:hypothetical protein